MLSKFEPWKFKHGHSPGHESSREYSTWRSMRYRCLNKQGREYPLYGGRGITICERWNEFSNFLADMGPRPEGMTIDRINNDGNYEPGNCRWATPKQQSNNQRKRKAKPFCGKGHFKGEQIHCMKCHIIAERERRKKRKALGIVKLRDLAPSQRAAAKLRAIS